MWKILTESVFFILILGSCTEFFPVVKKMKKINARKNPKIISTFDFSTLYTTISHDLLIKVMSEIVNFVCIYISKEFTIKFDFHQLPSNWTSKNDFLPDVHDMRFKLDFFVTFFP